MTHDSFDKLLRSEAERPDLAPSWQRQRATARELCRRFAAGSDTQLLADEVGMGKSYVALAVLADFVLGQSAKGGQEARALLITPPSSVLRSKWEQEIRSFSEAYLKPGVQGALRPLVLKSFWELVANLHDHANESSALRVSAGTYQCILLYLRQWAVRKGWLSNKHKPWGMIKGLELTSPEAMVFASRYSIAAFEAFLERANATGNDHLHAMVRPQGSLQKDPDAVAGAIKKLFREFAAQQDAYEPNVLILGMNALSTPRRGDNAQNQQFAIFVLSVLLKRRRKPTRKAVIRALSNSNPLFKDATLKEMDALSGVDLYRTRGSVDAVLEANSDLWSTWNAIVNDPAGIRGPEIKAFFSALFDGVVAHKLAQSGIQLAVIDEVHNWKSGANGARDFRQNFANGIRCKLLMSATPFQLAEGEMQRVFCFATSAAGATDKALRRMFGADAGPHQDPAAGGSLVEACLTANRRFRAAWARLPASDLHAFDNATLEDAELVRRLEIAATANSSTASLIDFCQAALAYRSAVTRLLVEQRQIMIRHVKPRDRRQFHAGRDYMDASSTRRSLYKVSGRVAPGDAFINFLAMRLEQKLRGEQDFGDVGAASAPVYAPVNARLARGMSSSKAAFRESRSERTAATIDLPADTLAYLKLFEETLSDSDHPKVTATVELALANYLRGRKTLIFCERVKTVEEIATSLRARIDLAIGDSSGDETAARDRIRRDALFCDVQWYRAWRRVSTPRVDAQASAVRASAVAFVAARLHGVPVTERRVLRLLDLWFLAEETRVATSPCQGAHRLLAHLGRLLDAGDEVALRQVLNTQSDTEAPDDDIAKSIDEVFQRGFLTGLNMWVNPASADFEMALWQLVDREANALVAPDDAPDAPNLLAFHAILMGEHGLQSGLRRVALRSDQLRRCLPPQAGETEIEAVFRGLREDRGGGESLWARLLRFVVSLREANGSINPVDKTNTRRRSLWRGVELRDERLVVEIDGSTKADQRVQWCAAFNSPLAPEVLICTAIGSEGIDLHKECAEIIHHDLPWNPARLEQRIGRIDRVGSLAEALGCHAPIRVGIPFLGHNYDQFQYDKLLSRAQVFEVLLGTPDFDLTVDEARYEQGDEEGDDTIEVDAEADATLEDALPHLPSRMVEWLSIDLSHVYSPSTAA